MLVEKSSVSEGLIVIGQIYVHVVYVIWAWMELYILFRIKLD